MSKYFPCPCWSKQLYHKCCKPYHDGLLPETALALMRSRYSAYALALVDYIIETTHPDNPHFQKDVEKWKNELNQFSKSCRFDGLKINQFVDGDQTASVSFTAGVKIGGVDASFTENSRFVNENGKWYYLSGETEE